MIDFKLKAYRHARFLPKCLHIHLINSEQAVRTLSGYATLSYLCHTNKCVSVCVNSITKNITAYVTDAIQDLWRHATYFENKGTLFVRTKNRSFSLQNESERSFTYYLNDNTMHSTLQYFTVNGSLVMACEPVILRQL